MTDFKPNTWAAGTNTPVPGSNDLYDVTKFGKDVVTNSITAGSTITLKQLLTVQTVDFDSTPLPKPQAGFCAIKGISSTFFTLQTAQVTSTGEMVYTFKAGTGKTSSTTQLPGVSINFATGAGDAPPGGGSKTNIYLFQIK